MYLLGDGRYDPEHIALIGVEDGQILTYADLASAVDSGRRAFHSSTSDLVFVVCRNDVSTILAYLAAVEAGHRVALLDEGIRPAALNRLLRIYRPDWILGPLGPETMREFQGFGVVKMPDSMPGLSLRRSTQKAGAGQPKGEAVLLSTSGSTGSPKFVRLTRDNLQSNARSIVKALGIGPTERAVTSLPLSYSFGLSVLNSHLWAGASVVVTGRSIVEKPFWDAFSAEGCTTLSGVPYTFELLRRLHFNRFHLPSLRSMTQAGGRLDSETITWFSELTQGWGARFFVMYGQTEATARISCLPPEDLPEKMGSVGPGSW